jgi:hypothetical protein
MQIIELQSILDEERSWRKQELSHARGLAEERAGRPDEAYLCRSWTLMIYAHCDQFLKVAARSYLQHLNIFPRDSYDKSSLWFAFKAKSAMFEGSEDNYRMCKSPNLIPYTESMKVAQSLEAIDQANFKYKQLRFIADWVLQIDFAHEDYAGFCTTLKTRRDQIAHGERSYVKAVDDCLPWHDPAIQLMDDLTEKIIARSQQA